MARGVVNAWLEALSEAGSGVAGSEAGLGARLTGWGCDWRRG